MQKADNIKRRRIADNTVKIISTLAAATGMFFLFWILLVVFQRGAAAWGWNFFTALPTPSGIEGGGLANAIVGTFLITAIATLIGVPVGIAAGVYLSEFGKHTKLGSLVRFTINITMGIPSIIVGLFVYAVLVIPFGFSAWSGSAALAIIMLPVVARTTEDMLSMVPNALRESALALGAPRWKSIIQIIFRAARNGLITGVLLAIARVSGETAPLLFTAMNSQYWMKSLSGPTANLTVTIYNYAMSPFDDWRELAWGASLLIMAAVLFLNIIARFIFKEVKR